MKEAELEEWREQEVLNCLFFVEPFAVIVQETGLERNIAADILKKLIRRKWVSPMKFDESQQDWVRSYIYDSDHMDDFRYLATREGLLHLHGRGE